MTTQVENLRAVSHFKRETFMVLQYARILEQWVDSKVLYFYRSYDSAPRSAMLLSAVATMAPLPSEGITPGMEE